MVVRGLVRRVVRGVVRRVVRGVGSVGSPRSGGQFFQLSLEERDQELQRYDALFLQVRNINSARDGEVSDLKIQLDELKVKLLHGEKAKEELQRHYQQVSDFTITHYHKSSIKPSPLKKAHFLQYAPSPFSREESE